MTGLRDVRIQCKRNSIPSCLNHGRRRRRRCWWRRRRAVWQWRRRGPAYGRARGYVLWHACVGVVAMPVSSLDEDVWTACVQPNLKDRAVRAKATAGVSYSRPLRVIAPEWCLFCRVHMQIFFSPCLCSCMDGCDACSYITILPCLPLHRKAKKKALADDLGLGDMSDAMSMSKGARREATNPCPDFHILDDDMCSIARMAVSIHSHLCSQAPSSTCRCQCQVRELKCTVVINENI